LNLGIVQSAIPTYQARAGAEFFTRPAEATQRRYEALRAYFVEGRPAAEIAGRLGYSIQAVEALVRDFRAGRRDFFAAARPGPKSAPAKEAARERIVALRQAGHSIDEIAQALAAEGKALNRTGISEVISEEGFERMWRRPETLRGGPRRDRLARTGIIDWDQWPSRVETRHAGLLWWCPTWSASTSPPWWPGPATRAPRSCRPSARFCPCSP
jgi:transposase